MSQIDRVEPSHILEVRKKRLWNRVISFVPPGVVAEFTLDVAEAGLVHYEAAVSAALGRALSIVFVVADVVLEGHLIQLGQNFFEFLLAEEDIFLVKLFIFLDLFEFIISYIGCQPGELHLF